jgi:hypothetical protein
LHWPQSLVSERDLIAALKTRHRARLIRSGNLQTKTFKSVAHLLDLHGFGLGQFTAAGSKPVFEPGAHIAAQVRGLGRDPKLVRPHAQNRPPVIRADQTIRGAFHMHHIGLARTQVQDGRTRMRGGKGALHDLLRRDRQIWTARV